MFSVTIDCPDLTFKLENEEELLGLMGAAVAQTIRARITSATGADGSHMPAPKDGGEALQRTGQLLRVIRPNPRVTRRRDGDLQCVVRPTTRKRRRVAAILSAHEEGRATYPLFYLNDEDRERLLQLFEEKARPLLSLAGFVVEK